MSENVIYCYSGTGNCLDMAKKIAKDNDELELLIDAQLFQVS